MIDRDALVECLKSNDFVAITYAKVSGEVTTRVATLRLRPEDQAPQGKRVMSEENFRYFECGAVNRFDPTAPGDWKSFKLANGVSFAPCPMPENWNG